MRPVLCLLLGFALPGCAALTLADAAADATVFTARTAAQATIGTGRLAARGVGAAFD
ncbi:hypothetical protein [Roseivivax sp. CAU 1761]